MFYDTRRRVCCLCRRLLRWLIFADEDVVDIELLPIRADYAACLRGAHTARCRATYDDAPFRYFSAMPRAYSSSARMVRAASTGGAREAVLPRR